MSSSEGLLAKADPAPTWWALGLRMVKRGDSPEIDAHGQEALNFQISMLIYNVSPRSFAWS